MDLLLNALEYIIAGEAIRPWESSKQEKKKREILESSYVITLFIENRIYKAFSSTKNAGCMFMVGSWEW